MNAQIEQAPQDDTLEDILYSLQSQRYEPGGYFTIGGVAGTYQLKSPFNTECEYSIVTVSATSTGGNFAISQSNPTLLAPTTTSSYGLATQGSESSNPLEGIAGYASGSAPLFYGNVWVPLGRGVFIYMNVTGSNPILATIAFRRAYSHLIPDRVRHLAPSTHSRPYSRRSIRMLESLSKQSSGFEAQYPQRKDGRETYHHEAIPWEQDPKGSLTNVRGQSRSSR